MIAPDATPRTPQDVLLKAAELIERDGWTRCQSQSPEGKRCASAAIEMVIWDRPIHRISQDLFWLDAEAKTLLQRVIGARIVA